jgi:hypothetical protein
MYRWRATLGPIANDYPLLGERGHAVYNGLSGNLAMFQNPNPALTILDSKLQAFDKAQQAVGLRTKGAAETRNLRAGELITCLESERSFVQELADANPEQAQLIIITSGMLVWQPPISIKPILQAVQGKPGAPVRVIANVGALTAETTGSVFYNWQYSADSGKSWVNLPSTNKGHTEVSGLAPMVTYTFRVNVTDSEGTGAWSQTADVFVL